MKILITGNAGYVGPGLVKMLRATYPGAYLIGYDMGYFGHCMTVRDMLPECYLNVQYFGDVRSVDPDLLTGVDVIIHLAAISNDPMGKAYQEVTEDINYRASVSLAKAAKLAGVKSFVFASSCSVYGAAGETARTEQSELNPLTVYAKSKINTERDLEKLADDQFAVTCLRFATACGMSDRLRLDLVLNDFVACAVASHKISILSDGTPWRPLIHVKDMARAMCWAIDRKIENGGRFLSVNAGCDEWNFQIADLANAVAKVIPNTEVSVNQNAQPDKRSYRVDFSLFKKLAPDHQPAVKLEEAIRELKEGLEAIGFQDSDFRNSDFMRLKILTRLEEQGRINSALEWTAKNLAVEGAAETRLAS